MYVDISHIENMKMFLFSNQAYPSFTQYGEYFYDFFLISRYIHDKEKLEFFASQKNFRNKEFLTPVC